LVILQNLNKVTHNIGKEGNTTEHNDNSQNPFRITNGIVVTIANGTQCGQGIVAGDNQLMHLRITIFQSKSIMFDEIVLVRVRGGLVLTKVPPAASNKVCYDHGNDNQSKDLINIEQEVVLHNSFVAG